MAKNTHDGDDAVRPKAAAAASKAMTDARADETPGPDAAKGAGHGGEAGAPAATAAAEIMKETRAKGGPDAAASPPPTAPEQQGE